MGAISRNEKDGFFRRNRKPKYYIGLLIEMGCPSHIMEGVKDITEMRPCQCYTASDDKKEQQIIRWDGRELYYYECGDWGFMRAQFDPSNGYVDFGYSN